MAARPRDHQPDHNDDKWQDASISNVPSFLYQPTDLTVLRKKAYKLALAPLSHEDIVD